MIVKRYQLSAQFLITTFIRIFSEAPATILFKIFDENLAEIVRPLTADVAKKFDVGKFLNGTSEADKELSKVFLKLKTFSDIGLAINTKLDFQTLTFFEWFGNDAGHMCECPIFSANARFSDCATTSSRFLSSFVSESIKLC